MHPLETLKTKPTTTVKRFAAELKMRIAKVEAAFAKPGQEMFVAGAHYITGVIDALLSDYDVRDPEDILRPSPPGSPGGTGCGTCGGTGVGVFQGGAVSGPCPLPPWGCGGYCITCGGKGYETILPGEQVGCSACNGTGRVPACTETPPREPATGMKPGQRCTCPEKFHEPEHRHAAFYNDDRVWNLHFGGLGKRCPYVHPAQPSEPPVTEER